LNGGGELESGVGMLVLSRKRDESIIVDGNIVITIVDIRGDKVRLGIEAPATVPVHRKEVYDALKRESAQAPGETSSGAAAGS
jgi:carbon storage regulator